MAERSGAAIEAELLADSDPAMAKLVARHGTLSVGMRRRDHDAFAELCRIVVGQQVSTAAARTIWGRVLDAFGGRPPDAEEAVGAEELLRSCGLSGRKASYVAGLGAAVLAGELDLGALAHAGDAEVVTAISALRGFGPWSAEMFLMFHLERPDVFSPGDLGLRNGIRLALGLGEPPTPAEAEAIAERWRPRRTLASLYLWAAVAAPPLPDSAPLLPPSGKRPRGSGGA